MKRLESFIFSIINSRSKKLLVILITLIAFVASIMMFPTKLVLAKMLPGKSDNTISLYVDAPVGSSFVQTAKISTCITDILKKRKVLQIWKYLVGWALL